MNVYINISKDLKLYDYLEFALKSLYTIKLRDYWTTQQILINIDKAFYII